MKLSTSILLAALASSTAKAAGGPLPFIDDDYAKARAEANVHHLPIFVEVWAPW